MPVNIKALQAEILERINGILVEIAAGEGIENGRTAIDSIASERIASAGAGEGLAPRRAVVVGDPRRLRPAGPRG